MNKTTLALLAVIGLVNIAHAQIPIVGQQTYTYTGFIDHTSGNLRLPLPPYATQGGLKFEDGLGKIPLDPAVYGFSTIYIGKTGSHNSAGGEITEFSCKSTSPTQPIPQQPHYLQLDGKWYPSSGNNFYGLGSVQLGLPVQTPVANCRRTDNLPKSNYTRPFLSFNIESSGFPIPLGSFSINPTSYLRFTPTYHYTTVTSRDGNIVCDGEIPAPAGYQRHPYAEVQFSLSTIKCKICASFPDNCHIE